MNKAKNVVEYWLLCEKLYAMEDPTVKKNIEETNSWTKAFVKYGDEKYKLDWDKNFMEISNFLVGRK